MLKKQKIMVFCSNPTDGGTAEIMAQTVLGLQQIPDFRVYPCVNKGNRVKRYKLIPDIEYLAVYSEVQILGELKQLKNIFMRFFIRIYRNNLYKKCIKLNIEKFKEYIITHQIDSVLIHNGGYVGDDLCNQLLEASSQIVMKHRVMVLHNDFCKTKIGMIRYARYDNKLSDWATDIITVSEFTRDRILKNSFIKQDIKVIYNGLPNICTLTEEEKRAIICLKSGVLNIGMIGNFQRNKGHLCLLKAIKGLLDNNFSEFRLSIIGNVYDKVYYEECRQFIEREGLLSYVKIFHNILNAGEFCSLFDFMVVPSLMDESFGLTACESMMKSTACIVSDTGGLPEVISDGVDGFVVPANNWQILMEKIQELSINQNLRNIMGKNAKDNYLLKFTVNKMIEEYVNILE